VVAVSSEFAANILSKCGIDPTHDIPSQWITVLPSLGDGFVQLADSWQQGALKQFKNEIPLETIERTVKRCSTLFQRKIIKSRLHALGIPSYGLHLLRNLIQPHHQQQERVLNWWGFQAYTQENLVKELLKLPSWMPGGHLYCYC
jgi:hypothetical protein